MITAGTAVTEAVQIIEAAGGVPAGVLVALDRQEVGQATRRTAVRELEDRLGIPVRSIVSMDDLVAHMRARPTFARHLPAMRAYRDRLRRGTGRVGTVAIPDKK